MSGAIQPLLNRGLETLRILSENFRDPASVRERSGRRAIGRLTLRAEIGDLQRRETVASARLIDAIQQRGDAF